jgi:hypothetical protein
MVTYLTERRPIRTTAEDCAIRGGEYVALDRADYGTALKVWMSAAQGGDPDAQYYVGVLYEKGAEGQPNYVQAANWYRQAAEKGISRAAVNLGRLYEQGLGVGKSADEAYKWYARASGLREASLAQLSGDGEKASNKASGHPGGGQTQIEGFQRELEETRTQLTERASLLDEERRRLQELKTADVKAGTKTPEQVKESGVVSSAQKISKEELEKQTRVVTEREREVGQLQGRVTTIKERLSQQTAKLQQGGIQDLGLRGPSIQIVDPPVVLTRGIRVEEGRIPVMIRKGRPARMTGRVSAPAGLRWLSVNDKRTVVDEQGMFTICHLSGHSPSEEYPSISWRRMQGKRGTMRLILTDPSNSAQSGEVIETTTGLGAYHALVIGNDHYRQWMPLNTAAADAEAVASY